MVLFNNNEDERQKARYAFDAPDTPPEAEFERVTRLVAKIFKVPIALVTLVDRERQWFKSCVGMTAECTPRDISFCTYAVTQSSILVVPDAAEDPRFRFNPLVTAEPGIHFYVGSPLVSADGFSLGSLCMIDRVPRPPLTDDECATLLDLTRILVDSLEVRRTFHDQSSSQAKALLQRSAAIDAASEGIALADSAGVLTYVNHAFVSLFGYDNPGAVTGKEWRWLYDAELFERFNAEVSDHYRREGWWRGETVGQHPDGSTFPMEMSLTALPGGNGMVCIARDVSARKAEEADRERLQRQFYQAQKMEAIGTLAGGIAHDFNNIIAAIQGYSSFLVEDLPEGSNLRTYAEQIAVATERAKGLVQQILAFSRRQEGDMRPVDLGHMVTETTSLLRATLPKSLAMQVNITAPSPIVLGDPTQISQVLMNLCVNARDAMGPDGGQLTVTLEEMMINGGCASGLGDGVKGEGQTPMRISADAEAGTVEMLLGCLEGPGYYLRIGVADSGCGISEQTMNRMFDPFFTTKGTGKGTGLGLAAVQGIVLGHHGAITVHSHLGQGTKFEVLLPLHVDVQPALVQHGPSAEKHSVTGQILLVDDEPQVLPMLVIAMERAGFIVHACASGTAALDAFSEDPDIWDLVVTDEMMPGMTGHELARLITEKRPELPIILCSGYVDALSSAEQAAAGIRLFVAKPVEPAELARLVRETLEQADDSPAALRPSPS